MHHSVRQCDLSGLNLVNSCTSTRFLQKPVGWIRWRGGWERKDCIARDATVGDRRESDFASSSSSNENNFRLVIVVETTDTARGMLWPRHLHHSADGDGCCAGAQQTMCVNVALLHVLRYHGSVRHSS